MKIEIKMRFSDSPDVLGSSLELRPEFVKTNGYAVDDFVRDLHREILRHAGLAELVK